MKKGVMFVFLTLAVVILICLTSLSGVFATDIGGCANLTSSGTYVLNTSVNAAATCMNIFASNITLDCNGFTINYSSTSVGYGVYTNSTNTTIKNCNINQTSTTASAYAIYFNTTGANNGLAQNNTITTRGIGTTAVGINFALGSNNTVYRNVLVTTGNGIYSSSSNYNNITENVFNVSGGNVISLSNSNYNTIALNNLTSYGTNTFGNGFSFTSGSSQNEIIGNIIIAKTSGTAGYGAHISSCDNNHFTGNIITTYNTTGTGINLYGTSTGNTFENEVYILTSATPKYINSSGTEGINNFTNCSFNKSRVTVTSTGTINVFWHTDVYVNDSLGNALNNTNITAYNNVGTLINTSLTNSSGWIPQRWIIMEYTQNATAIYNGTPHNFTANATGYNFNSANWTIIQDYISGVNPVILTLTATGGGDSTSPTYSGQGTNTTLAGNLTKFYIQYNDETALDSNGGYIFSTNNSGTWTNDSYVAWTTTPGWANITKTLNSTSGTVIGYRWYANDSAGNRNDTDIFILITTSSETDNTPTMVLNSPINMYNASQNITFNCTGTDDINLTNVTLYGNFSGSWTSNGTNTTPINNSPIIFIRTIPDGYYVWNCQASDNASQTSFATSNRTLIVSQPIINSSFDSGSIENYTFDSTGLKVNLSLHDDGLTHNWFYINVSNVLNKVINFSITNYGNTSGYSEGYPVEVVYSYDGGINWDRITDYSYPSGAYNFWMNFTQDNALVAEWFPYEYNRLQEYLTSLNNSNWVNITVPGLSTQGRNLYLVEITNFSVLESQKKQIYIISRNHPSESLDTILLEGLMTFLNSSNDNATQLRNYYHFYIVPMMNPDGVYAGNSRADIDGVNMNREWDSLVSDEINVIRQKINDTNNEVGIDLFLDFHGNYILFSETQPDVNYIAQMPSSYVGATMYAKLTNLYNNISARTLFNARYVPTTPTQGSAGIELFDSWGLLTTTPEIHHMDTSTWTQEELRDQGIDFVYAINNYFGMYDYGFNVSATNLTTNLVGYWKLDETSGLVAVDSLYLHNGTVYNTTINQIGKIGNAYLFKQGNNSYVNLGSSSALLPDPAHITESAWVKFTIASGNYYILSTQRGNPSSYFAYGTNGTNARWVYPNGTTTSIGLGNHTINDGNWHFLVFVKDGNTNTGYVDGLIDYTDTRTYSISPSSNVANIGSLNNATTYTFNGTIDEVGIWSRALNLSEITDLYNSGNGLTYPFATGTDLFPTSTLNSPINNYNSISLSIIFNCTGTDALNVTNVTLYGNWTGSWLANETNLTPLNGVPVIFSKTIDYGIYSWNCLVCDNASQCSFATSNRTFTMGPIINSNFDSGSIENYTFDSTRLKINLTLHDDGLYRYWFYINVSNVLNKRINFSIINYEPLYGYYGGLQEEMVYSYDNGVTWNRITDYSWSPGASGAYHFWKTFTQDDVLIAPWFPYEYNRLGNYLTALDNSAWINLTVLGLSSQGRNMYLVEITNFSIPENQKKQVYIISRQHASESLSTTTLEGFMTFLNSSNYNATRIRDYYHFYIVPMMNPDGVYAGNSRADADGEDMNRLWDDVTSDEVNLMKQKIEDLDAAVGIDLFMDFHGDAVADEESRIYNYVSQFPASYVGAGMYSNLTQLYNNISARTAFDTRYVPDVPTQGTSTIELFDDVDLFTTVIEVDCMDKDWTQADLRNNGEQFVYVINDYFGMYDYTSDVNSPTYSGQGTNTTINGSVVKFYIRYNDNTALNPNGGYIFSTNNSGTWANDSYVAWTSTPQWANVTKTLNSTSGLVIGYRWYANDSAGNRNDTNIFTLITTSGDSTAPTFSNNQTNSTYAGQNVKHSLLVTDETGLSGYIFSFDNCTGTFVNDSFVAFSTNPEWANVTKRTNSTVGCTIQWKVYANDTNNNWNSSSTYSYLTTAVPSDNPPTVTLNYPDNGALINNDLPDFNFTVLSEINETNISCELFINNTGYGFNNTVENDTETTITANSSLDDGLYSWHVNCTDLAGTSQSETRSFTIDTQDPEIDLISPENNQAFASGTTSITFQWNVTDNLDSNMSCNVYTKSVYQEIVYCENATICEQTIPGFSPGSYSYGVNCSDGINENVSESKDFSIYHSGGGGGGETTTQNTDNITNQPIYLGDVTEERKIGKLENGQTAYFEYENETHTIKVQNLSEYQVTLLIKSEPIQVIINKGETKQIDLNGDGKNDLEIIFNGLSNDGKANLVINPIAETPLCEEGYKFENGTCIKIETQKSGICSIWAYIILSIIIIGLLVYFIVSASVKKKKRY